MIGRKRVLSILAILFLIILAAGSIYAEKALSENVLMIGESRLKNLARAAINNSTADTWEIAGAEDSLVHVEHDQNGNVTLVQADGLKINEIAGNTASLVQSELEKLSLQTINVPIGNVTGIQLLSGRGPKIKIKIQPVGTASTSFYSEFESAGINQTRHKIYIVIDATMRMIAGRASQTVDVSSELLVSETIIVGVVPDSFVNVESTDDLLNLLP